MSLSADKKKGVKIRTVKRHGAFAVAVIIAAEAIFSFFLYLAIAGKIFAPLPVEAQPGVPNLISYQGRLTDTSGNPLGGTGTVYCFRYSIFDAQSGGNQLWPANGSATTTPSNSTTTVTDGVFSDQIGRVDNLASSSLLDFMSTSTYYLQVQVSTSSPTCASGLETLAPRQQIVSDAWARTAANVYGSIRTNVANKVQIGSGAGAQSGYTLLTLDQSSSSTEAVGNACPSGASNGSLWYNNISSRALVCENNLIQAISNASTTIAGITVNATSVTAGTVVFQNGNNVSFGINGSTITATAAAGGGGATLSNFYYPPGVMQSAMSLLLNASGGVLSLVPFQLNQALTASRVAIMASITGTTSASATTQLRSNQISLQIGIYTRGGGTSTASIYAATSIATTWSWSWNGTTNTTVLQNITGWRRLSAAVNINATPGEYWYGVWISQAQTNTASGVVVSLAIGDYNSTLIYGGNISAITNSSRQPMLGMGIYSNNTTSGLTTSMPITYIFGGGATGTLNMPWILFTDFDMN